MVIGKRGQFFLLAAVTNSLNSGWFGGSVVRWSGVVVNAEGFYDSNEVKYHE